MRRAPDTVPWINELIRKRARENRASEDKFRVFCDAPVPYFRHMRLGKTMLRNLIDYEDPTSFGSRMRRKRFRYVADVITATLETKSRCSVLDVGGTGAYWLNLPTVLRDVTDLTILNLAAPKGARVDAGVPKGLNVTFTTGDGTDLRRYGDGDFDLVHSNSVIEHVGLYRDMVRFANETQRVGVRYFVQTPNLWFPVDPHYGLPVVHWIPWSARARLLSTWKLGFKGKFETFRDAIEYAEFVNLIDRRVLSDLFPTADIFTERFLLFAKSIMAIGPSHNNTRKVSQPIQTF